MGPDLREVLEHALGSSIVAATPVRGGDVAVAYAIDLADGRVVFAKTHAGAPEGFFTTEALGLRWLRDGSPSDGSISVPEVLAVSDGRPNHLVLEWITEGRARGSADHALGTGLAHLHRAGAPSFGREDRRTTGSRGLPNEPCATWSDFYATNRLLPLARLAGDAGALPESSIGDLARLAGTLDRFGAADEPPARLHGDLWGGNRLVDGRRSQLARRSRRPRWASGVRSGDDAIVRRLRAGVLRRLRRRRPARNGVGGTGGSPPDRAAGRARDQVRRRVRRRVDRRDQPLHVRPTCRGESRALR